MIFCWRTSLAATKVFRIRCMSLMTLHPTRKMRRGDPAGNWEEFWKHRFDEFCAVEKWRFMTVLLERLQTPLQGSDDSIACWWPKAPQMFQQMVGTTIRSFSSYCRDDGYDLHITQDKQKILETHSRNTSPKTCQRKFRMTALMRGGIYSDDPGRPRRAVFSKFGFAEDVKISLLMHVLNISTSQ